MLLTFFHFLSAILCPQAVDSLRRHINSIIGVAAAAYQLLTHHYFHPFKNKNKNTYLPVLPRIRLTHNAGGHSGAEVSRQTLKFEHESFGGQVLQERVQHAFVDDAGKEGAEEKSQEHKRRRSKMQHWVR